MLFEFDGKSHLFMLLNACSDVGGLVRTDREAGELTRTPEIRLPSFSGVSSGGLLAHLGLAAA
jgi:hypothetical protein